MTAALDLYADEPEPVPAVAAALSAVPTAPAPVAPAPVAPAPIAPAPAPVPSLTVAPEPSDARAPGRPSNRPSGRPSSAVRLDPPPRPVLRLLSEVLVELRAAAPVDPPAPGTAGAPPALRVVAPLVDPDRAEEQARGFAARLFTATAEILDGRRPVAHLAGICTPDDYPRVTDHLTARRATSTRGAPGRARCRVTGVRLCGLSDDVVEAAAVLHGPTRSRAVTARLTRDGATAPWRVRVLVVL